LSANGANRDSIVLPMIDPKEKRLAKLREEYARTEDLAARAKIQADAEKIKARVLCRVCEKRGSRPDDEHFPFCSYTCHEVWAVEHYGKARQTQRPDLATG
jgi:endogenous inhibitor of DNA gyrase (YacG/DUF329 family)